MRLLDLQILLEEAERLNAVARPLDLDAVERIALGEAELAPDDLVAGDGVAVDVDPLDIDARRIADPERDVHGALVFVPLKLRPDVGESIATQTGRLVQQSDRVLNLLGVVPRSEEHTSELPSLMPISY